jgi:hypothetical protein
MWRQDPATTMVIGWNQISGQSPVILYDIMDHGEDASAYSFSQPPDKVVFSKGMNNHFVRLKYLLPNTTYYFIIKDSEGCSVRMSFKTAPDNPYERLSIIAGGDSRNFREARQNANKIVAKLRPHCVMFGGDMTGGDRASQWKPWFDDWQLTTGPDGHLIPIIATRGNHESSNKTLVDLFDVPSKKVHYALSFGGNLLRIYTLNSLIASGGDQKIWLEQDLQNHQDVIWKTAQYHFAIRPHTSKKAERNNQVYNWANLFYEYQVNLVVESDAHVVKWTYPIRPSNQKGSDEGFIRDDHRGTVYVGEGCWGAPLRSNNDNKKWTRNSASFNQFKWIFVDMDRMEIRTVKTDNAAKVAFVNSNDIFSTPEGLKLWKPNNGSVVIIDREKGGINNPMIAEKSNLEIIDFSTSLAGNEIAIRWATENESSVDEAFEVQRTIDGNNFQTIASVNVSCNGSNSYEVIDRDFKGSPVFVSYRIKHIPSSGIPRVTPAVEFVEADYQFQNLKKLYPDPKNGMIRAKYVVNHTADISIELVDYTDKIFANSKYQNQRSGNYLRSIDMKKMPLGKYLLTIKADDAILEEYLVLKEPNKKQPLR